MLVENTEPRARSIGKNLILIPGVNQVDTDKWDELVKSPQWGKPIAGLEKRGILVINDPRKKITIKMIESTYDPNLLSQWLADPKNSGPLRGAIRKQLKALEVEEAI